MDVEPSGTVGDLRRALTGHAVARDASIPPGASLWTDEGRRLDDDHLVAGSGLRSGLRVWLSNRPPSLRTGAPAVDDVVDASGGVPFVRRADGWASPEPARVDRAPPPPSAGRKFRNRRRFRSELERWATEVRAAMEQLGADRNAALPPLSRLIEDARTRQPSLWARGREAADLLLVRLGRADGAPRLADELGAGGHAAVVRGRPIDVPVELDLERAIAVAFHGDADVVDGVVRSVVGQIVAGHGPEHVVVTALLSPSALRGFEWLRWLPHVRSPASPLSGEHLAASAGGIADVLAALLDVPSGHEFPRIVVVVDERAAVDRDRLARLLDRAGDTGIRILWLGRDEALVPPSCSTVVRLTEGVDGSTRTSAGMEPTTFTAEAAHIAPLDALARHLAPVHDVSSVVGVGSLPREVGLTSVLGGTPAPADIAAAWSVSDGGFLDAPVGIGPGGTFSLDLAEHGPHAVIAGTTGSGKTELLRSWVLALAARHPPERLTFLFVQPDHGTALAPLSGLPHHVGTVPDVDLRTEMDGRTTLLAVHHARDLTELAALDPVGCPPRLVVVVDENAGAVRGLAGLAELRRDIGIHVLLATRHPGTTIDEPVLDEINLRIVLRTEDADGSVALIGSGQGTQIAASLPGRALARIGHGELRPFQAAWSGARREPGDAGRVRVAPLGFGRPERPQTERSASDDVGSGPQLDVVLHAIRLAFERSGRRAPRRR